MIHAPPVMKAISSQTACFSTLRPAFLALSGDLSSRIRAPRSPSIQRSTCM
jgi:hypothetical protein